MLQFSSVQFSHSVVSDSLWPHGSQHTRPPCPSPSPGVHSDSRPLSPWCHPAISPSVVSFFSCPQSLPASESFPMSLWTVVLKTLESPLDCKEIQPVHSEGDQPWDFFGRNDVKAEAPVLWPPHAKSWLIGMLQSLRSQSQTRLSDGTAATWSLCMYLLDRPMRVFGFRWHFYPWSSLDGIRVMGLCSTTGSHLYPCTEGRILLFLWTVPDSGLV